MLNLKPFLDTCVELPVCDCESQNTGTQKGMRNENNTQEILGRKYCHMHTVWAIQYSLGHIVQFGPNSTVLTCRPSIHLIVEVHPGPNLTQEISFV